MKRLMDGSQTRLFLDGNIFRNQHGGPSKAGSTKPSLAPKMLTLAQLREHPMKRKKAAELKKKSKGIKTLGQGFWINFAITVILTLVFVYIASSINEGGEVNSFDPFTILEVPSGSDLKIIKKAYKKLGIKWHPEKNPNNPSAEAKFMMVQMAYWALTDPVAKENFEKFGNPDGKQPLEVSIGLPSWLLDSDNRNFVLMAYLIIMVGVIPFCVWKYYSNSSKFGEKDVMYDTYSRYHHSLDDSTSSVDRNDIEFLNQRQTDTKNDSELIGENEMDLNSRSSQHYIEKEISTKTVPQNSSNSVQDDWILLPEVPKHLQVSFIKK